MQQQKGKPDIIYSIPVFSECLKYYIHIWYRIYYALCSILSRASGCHTYGTQHRTIPLPGAKSLVAYKFPKRADIGFLPDSICNAILHERPTGPYRKKTYFVVSNITHGLQDVYQLYWCMWLLAWNMIHFRTYQVQMNTIPGEQGPLLQNKI